MACSCSWAALPHRGEHHAARRIAYPAACTLWNLLPSYSSASGGRCPSLQLQHDVGRGSRRGKVDAPGQREPSRMAG
jgi:hypothetical protein